MRRNEVGPEAVSRAIQKAIEAPKPKRRYLVAVALPGRLVMHLGDGVWDAVLRRSLKIRSTGTG